MKYAVVLLRYLKGYVRLRAEGGFPERFLNLCHSRGISLWDVCLKNNALTFCVSRRQFIRLRNAVRKSGVKITVTEKSGLIYRYRSYSKRIGLVSGTALFLAVHLVLSMFVWCVDVSGNSTLSKSEITELAEKTGLRAGTMKRDFDEIRAARTMAAEYNGKITWLSVNIKGSLAVIELREDNRIIPQAEDNPPCNIVADFDGVILSAETFYGDCMIKRGIAVKKGDLLINGAIINEDMSTTFYAAKGRITALHDSEIQMTEKYVRAAERVKITESGRRIGFFGLTIPLSFTEVHEGEAFFSERKSLCINGLKLPFYTEKILLWSQDKQAEENHYIYSLEKMQSSLYTAHSDSTVTEKSEQLQVGEKGYVFSGKYTLIDFIGEEKPILSETQK